MNELIRTTEVEAKASYVADLIHDEQTVYKHAPALFAKHPHPKMSGRYSFSNTYDLITYMRERGFRVTSVMGGTSSYNAVMVRMRHEQHGKIGDGGAPEFIIGDSHDGSRQLNMLLGYIEFICMNGLIAGNIMYNRKFRHTAPDLMDQVRLELDDIDAHVRKLLLQVAAMRNYKTTIGERMLLADEATKVRFDIRDDDNSFIADMRPKLLAIRRADNASNDLFTVMNVIQENAIRGGAAYATRNNRMQRMRAIGSVDRNLGINQRIWLAAERIMTAAQERDSVIEHKADVDNHS